MRTYRLKVFIQNERILTNGFIRKSEDNVEGFNACHHYVFDDTLSVIKEKVVNEHGL